MSRIISTITIVGENANTAGREVRAFIDARAAAPACGRRFGRGQDAEMLKDALRELASFRKKYETLPARRLFDRNGQADSVKGAGREDGGNHTGGAGIRHQHGAGEGVADRDNPPEVSDKGRRGKAGRAENQITYPA